MKKIFILFIFSNSFFAEAQTTNIDFESTPVGAYTTSNAVSSWTISSQTNTSGVCNTSTVWTPGSPEFSIVSTPIAAFPVIGNILQSPFGGSNVARLNNTSANGTITKLIRTYSVTAANSLLKIAWAGLWQDSHSLCCENASFYFLLKDQFGALLSCSNVSMATSIGCQSSVGYSTTSGGNFFNFWSNWQVKDIDLNPYLNSVITIEIISSDCSYGDHYGTLFFDADLPYTPPPISYCQGNYFGLATITAPFGYYTYSWNTPGFPLNPWGSQPQITYAQGVYPGLTYTLYLDQYIGPCPQTILYTFSNTPTVIDYVKTSTTCVNGSAGSATVFSNASAYSWSNSTGSVISTSSVINNVPAGNYTVTASGCSIASTSVSIGTGTPAPHSVLQSFCNLGTYLTISGGTNYQWYHNNSAITSSLGGTSSIYTVTAPTNLDTIVVAYNTNGCRDSVNIILVATAPGTIFISSNPLVCPSATNGLAVVSITPAFDATGSSNSFSVFSTGTTSSFNATLNPTSAVAYTVSGLSAGGTYSVNASDGACKYNTTFSITPYIFNFTVNPSSTTLCNGSPISTNINFGTFSYPGQYSYSWTPTNFLVGTLSSPIVILNPTVNPGLTNTFIYTVVVTPSLINCPQTKTISITAANPITPTITSIPALCSNNSTFAISANPGGGHFLDGTSVGIDYLTGIFDPSLQPIGINTFTYVNSIGPCSAKSTGTFIINPIPILSVSGNTLLCEGQSTSLLANGADTYSWSISQANPFITITPTTSSNYNVVGTDALTNCSTTKTITVTVVPYPVLTISGDTLLCPGQSSALIASGADSYLWNNGIYSFLNSVSPNSTTTFSIIGTSSLVSCSSTQAITVKVADCNFVGLKELNLNESISVYPNPTNGKITIESKKTVLLSLRDGLGRILLEDKTSTAFHVLDLSDYPKGIYFLKLNNERSSATIKLIKTD